jgi:hypothetical protein
MPVHRGQDSSGCFYQWGYSGKKYYYPCGDSFYRTIAKQKAEQQQRAVYSRGWREKYKR